MPISRFEDILAWQKAKELTLGVYRAFGENRDYSFRDQIQRASVSVMNNIAEGFERKGDREFQRFLYIAKGSAGEIRSMLYLARELKYITEDRCSELLELSKEISNMLYGFIKSLE